MKKISFFSNLIIIFMLIMISTPFSFINLELNSSPKENDTIQTNSTVNLMEYANSSHSSINYFYLSDLNQSNKYETINLSIEPNSTIDHITFSNNIPTDPIITLTLQELEQNNNQIDLTSYWSTEYINSQSSQTFTFNIYYNNGFSTDTFNVPYLVSSPSPYIFNVSTGSINDNSAKIMFDVANDSSLSSIDIYFGTSIQSVPLQHSQEPITQYDVTITDLFSDTTYTPMIEYTWFNGYEMIEYSTYIDSFTTTNVENITFSNYNSVLFIILWVIILIQIIAIIAILIYLKYFRKAPKKDI